MSVAVGQEAGAAGAQADLLAGGGAGSDNPGGQDGGGGGTGGSEGWITSLPEELRGEPSLNLHKDIASLAKSYLNAQRLVGADKIPVPGKNATADDWKAVFRKLGVPESADKYEFKVPEGANPEIIKEFKQIAHEAGVLPSQAEKLVDFYQKLNGKASEAIQLQQKAKIEEGYKELQKEWGNAFDRELETAKSGLKAFGDEKFSKFLKESGLSQNAEVIRFMNKIGKSLGEGTFKGEGVPDGAMTPAQAKARIESLKGDFAGPYYNSEHPGHKAAVAEVQRLYEQMYPTNV